MELLRHMENPDGTTLDPKGVEDGPPNVEEKEQYENRAIDALIVFGAGIRADKSLEKKGMGVPDSEEGSERWRLPIVAKLRAVAAAEVYLTGSVLDVVFTGGAVMAHEGVQESEADLMKRYFLHILANRKRKEIKDNLSNSLGHEVSDEQKKELDDEINQQVAEYIDEAAKHVIKEDKATNTIENFSHTINHIEADPEKYRAIGLMSNEFHIDRIMLLAEKYMVDNGIPLGAESIIVAKREKYRKLVEHYFNEEGNQEFRERVLSAFDEEESIAQIGAKFGPRYGLEHDALLSQTESRLGGSFKDTLDGEQRWTRGLKEIPEYWMQGLRFVENPERLRAILKGQQELSETLEQRGINLDEANIDEIRHELEGIDRVMPPQEWAKQ